MLKVSVHETTHTRMRQWLVSSLKVGGKVTRLVHLNKAALTPVTVLGSFAIRTCNNHSWLIAFIEVASALDLHVRNACSSCNKIAAGLHQYSVDDAARVKVGAGCQGQHLTAGAEMRPSMVTPS